MVKLGSLLSYFKAWSNFRLMVVVGSVVTLASLGLGAVVVQAALSDDTQSEAPSADPSPSNSNDNVSGALPREPADSDPPVAAGSQPQTGAQIPVLEGNDSFRISCSVGDPNRSTNTCQVESFGGFNERVTFSCADLPENVSCSFVPASVTPRGTGTTPFRIELSAGNVPAGSYDFEVIGRSRDKVSRIRYPWGVSPAAVAVPRAPAPPPVTGQRPAPQAPAAPAAEPTFSFTCGSLSEGNKLLWSLSKDGSNVKINCFLTPLNGFNEPVAFTYAQSSELARPATVSFALDQLQARKQFDLNFEFSDSVKNLSSEQLKTGVDYVFDVTGTSASGKSLTRPVTLTVKE